MAADTVLVVDDEQDVRDLVEYNLEKAGYDVTSVGTGEDAVTKAKADVPTLIILDLMLPGIDGLDVCRALKADSTTETIPVIMLTAKGEEADIVTGLELGADDYIVKPFSPRVLLARAHAILRKQPQYEKEAEGTITRNELVIDPDRHEVTVSGEPVELTFTEFRILQHLAKRPGRVYSRNQIINAVRGGGYPVTERSVDVQIVGLRKKLGPAGERIETVRGVGYRFRD